jgi:hypothetical protein
MAIYNLIKKGKVVNTIIADEVDSIRDQYDSIEEIVTPDPVDSPLVSLEPLPPPPLVWKVEDIRNNLTFAEKVSWDNNTNPAINTAKIDLPRGIEYVTELLDYLVTASVISPATRTKILNIHNTPVANTP